MSPIARVGERILLNPPEPGVAPVVGTVLEVGGEVPCIWYRVHWENGTESAVFPCYTPHRLLPGNLRAGRSA
jgi:hypothetical protein